MKTITIKYHFDGNDFDYEVYKNDYNKALEDFKECSGETDEDELAEMVKDYFEDSAYEEYENQQEQWQDEINNNPDIYKNNIHGGI
jgi:hypothetical protein